MSSIDWKNNATLDLQSLRDDPVSYVRAIFLRKEWSTLLALSCDVAFSPELKKALKVPFVAKQLFATLSADDILKLLAASDDVYRKRYLTILVDRFEKLPVAESVGKLLFESSSTYPWIIPLSRFVISLQPNNAIEQALKGKLRRSARGEVLLEGWRQLLASPSETDSPPASFGVYFVDPRILISRKSLGGLFVNRYIDLLKTEKSTSMVLATAMQTLTHFQELWIGDAELYGQLKAAVREYEYELDVTGLNTFLSGSLEFGTAGFLLHPFSKWGFIDDEFVMSKYVVNSLDAEKELGIDQQVLGAGLLNSLMVAPNGVHTLNFHRALHTEGIESPDSPLGQIGKRFFANIPVITAARTVARDYGLFQAMAQYLTNAAGHIGDGCAILSYDTAVEAINASVRAVLDGKTAQTKIDPTSFTSSLVGLFLRLVWTNNAAYYAWNQSCAIIHTLLQVPVGSSVFYVLPVDLRDQLVVELIREPSGLKPLNPELAQLPYTTALHLMLFISDLKLISTLTGHGIKDVTDKYGFVPSHTLNLPPFGHEASQKAEPLTGPIHGFELALIKKRLLQHLDATISKKAIDLYSDFTTKVLDIAFERKDAVLTELAVGVHYRFCRWCLGKTRDDLRPTYLTYFIAKISDPLALEIGSEHSTDFGTTCFDSLIVNVPMVGIHPVPFPLYQLVMAFLTLSGSKVFRKGEEVAAGIVPLVLEHLFSKLTSAFQISAVKPVAVALPAYFTPRGTLEWKRGRLNASNDLKMPEKFRSLVLKHYLSSKVRKPCKYPVLSEEYFWSSEIGAVWPGQFLSSRVLVELVRFISKRVPNYVNAQFTSPSTKTLLVLLNEVKTTIAQNVNFVMKAPQPDDVEAYVTKTSQVGYQGLLQKFGWNLQLSFASVPLLLRYSLGSPLEHFFEYLQDQTNYKAFQSAVTFSPQNVAQTAPEYVTLPRNDYCPTYTVSLTANEYIMHRTQNVVVVAGKKVNDSSFRGKVARAAIGPILDIDAAKFISETPDGQSFAHLTIVLSQAVNKLSSPTGDFSIIGRLLGIIFEDIARLDPEPTEKDPNPPPAFRYFKDLEGQVPGPVKAKGRTAAARPGRVGGRGRGRRVQRVAVAAPVAGKESQRPPGLPQYQMGIFLIARIADSVRKSGLLSRLDFDLFLDPLLAMLKVPGDKLTTILGLNNPHHFASELALLILSRVTFPETIQTADYWKTSTKPMLVLYNMLSSPVFHSAASDAVFQYLQQVSSYPHRHAVLSVLTSGFTSDTFEYALQSRTMIMKWLLSPSVVGFPLPQLTIDFLSVQAKDEKAHVDVRRTVVAGTVAYFRYQSVSGNKPVQAVELLGITEPLCAGARDAMLPFCISCISQSLTQNLRSASGANSQLLPTVQDPKEFVIGGIGPVEFPTSGEWRPFYVTFLSNYIASGLLSSNQQLLLLVIGALTTLCSEAGEAAKQIAPFLLRGLAPLDVGRPATTLLNFAFHFCFVSAHKEFTELIDAFVGVFGRLRKGLDEWIEEHLTDLCVGKLGLTGYQTYIQNFLIPFTDVLRAKIAVCEEAEEIEWLQELSKRILIELKPELPLLVVIQQFNALTNWFVCLGDVDFCQAIRDVKKGGDIWKSVIKVATRLGEHAALVQLIQQVSVVIPREVICEVVGLDPVKVPNLTGAVKRAIAVHCADEEFCKTVLPKIAGFAIF
jgi:hypothetical protein